MSYYIIEFLNGDTTTAFTYSECIQYINDSINRLGEIAIKVTELDNEDRPKIIYKPKYSAIMEWTKIVSNNL